MKEPKAPKVPTLVDLKCVLQVRHLDEKFVTTPEAVVGAKRVFLRDHPDPLDKAAIERLLAEMLLDRLLADLAELRAFLGSEAPVGEPARTSLLSRHDLMVVHQALISASQLKSDGPVKDEIVELVHKVKDLLR